MKILVPLSCSRFIERYVQAGADEFYLGFHDQAWSERFGTYADINRMSGFGSYANRTPIEEVADVIDNVHSYRKKIYITLNANEYSPERMHYIETVYFPILKEADGIIISTVTMAEKLKEYGIPTVASTMCGIYNSDLVDLYANAGVTRIILPRDLMLNEIEEIIHTHSDKEFEVFFMRNGCILSDAHCLGMHRPECGATCAMLRYKEEQITSDYTSFQDKHDTDVNSYLYNSMLLTHACALCAVYRLQKIGVHTLKIVGRSDEAEQVEEDVRLSRMNLDIAAQCTNEEEYLERMIFPPYAPQVCRMGLSCYYPEVRFGRKSSC